MSGRILVAIDLSPSSAQALQEAQYIAKTTDKTLGMVHVLPDFMGVATLGVNGYVGTLPDTDDLATRARERIRAWAQTAEQDAAVELFLEQGAFATRIVERAESWGAELIVVGSHGHSGLTGLVLGSVAKRVVHHAHCPVLVSRGAQGRALVVAATDLSDPSLPAIARGASEARWRSAELLAVHVVDVSMAVYAASAGGMFGLTVPLPPAELHTDVMEALAKTLTDAMAQCEAAGESKVLYGNPAEAIIQCARERGARLIVVGTHGRSGLARIALGSTADAVVTNAHCSVLVVRHTN
jgi:nucleotide-binding universal stress UspA family protein